MPAGVLVSVGLSRWIALARRAERTGDHAVARRAERAGDHDRSNIGVQWISRPGPARRRGRGARDGRRPPVVGRQFRPSQPGSTPLLRLTPAFTTEERVARGRRRIGDCTTDGLTGGRAARPPAHDSCAAGPSAKRYYPWKVSGQSAGGHSSSPSWRPWGRLRGQRWAGRWAGAAGGAAHLDP